MGPTEISRDDLLVWVRQPSADTMLPELIRRLIDETAQDVVYPDFPSGTGVSSGGFDGFVMSAGGSFVPTGPSVWELSVDASPGTKADNDYNKRNSTPDGRPVSETSYVQVIVRPWIKASEWARGRREEHTWADVRGLNVDNVAQWLAGAPRTHAWFAETFGKARPGVFAFETWWEAWLASTTPSLDISIVLAGREYLRDKLNAAVQAGTGIVSVGGDCRLDEVKAFVCAAAAAASDPSSRLNNLLLIDNAESLRALAAQSESLTVLTTAEILNASNIDTSRHVVIIASPGLLQANITLPSVDGEKVATELTNLGVEFFEGQRLGWLARRSLLALRRKLANDPSRWVPDWAAPGASDVIRRTLLLGGWDDVSPGDRARVAGFAGLSYADLEAELRSSLRSNDPLVDNFETIWSIVTPVEAWSLLSSQLTREDIRLFSDLAFEVLSEVDPRIRVAPEDRWRASMLADSPRYSARLRAGVARSVALFGAIGVTTTTGRGVSREGVCASIVRRLLEAADKDETGDTWRSLAPHLPILIEGATNEVLSALGRGFRGAAPRLSKMFEDNGQSAAGTPPSSAHTDMLRALERAAWSNTDFARVVQVLANMTVVDPGGGWSNRPFNSLRKILSPTLPRTSATLQQKKSAIRNLARTDEALTWRVLEALISDRGDTVTTGDGPVLRDWGEGFRRASREEVRGFVDEIVKLMLELCGTNGARLSGLAKISLTVTREASLAIAAYFRRIAPALSEEARGSVWRALRKTAAHHRQYPQAAWSRDSEEISAIEALMPFVEPSSPIEKSVWLFSGGLLEVGSLNRFDDIEEYDRTVQSLREDAVRTILEELGFGSLLELSYRCESPRTIGVALAAVDSSAAYRDLLTPLLESEEDASLLLARSYYSIIISNTEQLAAALAVDLSSEARARIIASLGDESEEWRALEAEDEAVKACYWGEFTIAGRGRQFAGVRVAAESLWKHGREGAALDAIALYSDASFSNDDIEYVASLLEQFAGSGERVAPDTHLLDEFDYTRLIELMREHSALLGVRRVAMLEWKYLGALGFEADVSFLGQLIATDPGIFVELVKMQTSGDASSLSENSYSCLTNWRILPGVSEDGLLNTDDFWAWLNQVRQLTDVEGVTGLAENYVGEVLARYPTREGESWPAAEVVELLEELASGTVNEGFRIATLNGRGVTIRSMYAGGKQEVKLAATYESRAVELQDTAPEVAALLRDIADGYKGDSDLQDSSAERRRRGL